MAFWWNKSTRKKPSLYLKSLRLVGETLLPEIGMHIMDGSIIISNGWGAYKQINQHLAHHNFQHFTVNHKKHFVDGENKNIHTQNIENLWGELR